MRGFERCAVLMGKRRGCLVPHEDLREEFKSAHSLKKMSAEYPGSMRQFHKALDEAGCDRAGLIVRQYREGFTVRELMSRHGLGHRNVRAMLATAGIDVAPRHQLRGLSDDKFRACFAAAPSDAALARQLGIDRGTVKRTAQRLGLRR